MVTDAILAKPHCHASLVIEAKNIHKAFANKPVLKGLDLELQPASVFALLGPNGAGKSTLISLLTGVARADQGYLRILGLDPAQDPIAVKRQIGVVPEELALFERLTGRQQLHFCAQLHGLDRTTSEQRCEELLRLTDLVSAGNQLIDTYSKGMRRRLAIAAALIHGPALVFLDEPFDGIDVIAAGVIRELLQELRRAQVSLLLTTHILEIADRLVGPSSVILLHDLMWGNHDPFYRCDLTLKSGQWANGGPYRAVSELDPQFWEWATLPWNNGLTLLRKKYSTRYHSR